MAGIRAARGNWIATLDADLQNDPADLIRLWRALVGYDGVLGWRVKRQDVWSKRVISYWANLVRNKALGQSIRDTGCSVRIFPRDVALRLPAFNGMHRFFGSLLLREGCHLVQVPVHHRPRSHGRSHYNFWNRSFQVVIDLLGVIWLMHRPLHYEVIQHRFRRDDAKSESQRHILSLSWAYAVQRQPRGLSRVEPDILVDDRFFGPGAVYCAVSRAVGGLGEEAAILWCRWHFGGLAC